MVVWVTVIPGPGCRVNGVPGNKNHAEFVTEPFHLFAEEMVSYFRHSRFPVTTLNVTGGIRLLA